METNGSRYVILQVEEENPDWEKTKQDTIATVDRRPSKQDPKANRTSNKGKKGP